MNEKAACPAGTRTSGKDLEDKENSVCEKNIITLGESQDGWPREAYSSVAAKYKVASRAVHIAAVVMNAAGLCRYDTVDKCRHRYPNDETCEKCIEKWLLAKARKELRHG